MVFLWAVQNSTRSISFRVWMHDADLCRTRPSHTHTRCESSSSSLQTIRVNWINFGNTHGSVIDFFFFSTIRFLCFLSYCFVSYRFSRFVPFWKRSSPLCQIFYLYREGWLHRCFSLSLAAHIPFCWLILSFVYKFWILCNALLTLKMLKRMLIYTERAII